jgi:hypothetical protein
MSKKIPNIFIKHTPRLEIGEVFRKPKIKGDDPILRELTEDEIKRGGLETIRVRGRLTFISDGSKCEGTREIFLGEPIYRIGNDTVDEVMFLPYEYFARKSDVD